MSIKNLDSEIIDEALSILKHPIRRDILEVLWLKDRSFVELINICEKDHGKLGQHLRKMNGVMEHDPGRKVFQLNNKGRLIHEFITQGLFGLQEAIARSKKTESTLNKYKSRFQTLYNLIPDPVAILDLKGKILACNDRIEKKTGFKKEELLGKNFSRTKILTRKSKTVLKKNLTERKIRGNHLTFEIELLTKNSEVKFFEVNATKIEYEGKGAYLITCRDISERVKLEEERKKYTKGLEDLVDERTAKLRESEEHYKQQNKFLTTIIESISHPFYVIDANNYRIRIANSAAGLVKLSKNSTCYALTHRRNKPCNSHKHPCTLQIVKKTKKPITLEHIHWDKDGSARKTEIHAFPIFDVGKNVSHIIEYAIDISERKKANARYLP